MNNKHHIHLFTSADDIQVIDNETTVTVYWQVNFNRDLDRFFNKRKYKHDFDLLKEGVGRLVVRVLPKKTALSDEYLLAYVETLAAKHVVSTNGLNAFGFTDHGMTIRRDQLHFHTSQALTRDLLDRKGQMNEIYSLEYIGVATGNSAGYLYGATAEFDQNNSTLKDREEFDFYNTTTDIQIREADNARTDLADIVIDYRSVDEWMNMEWVRYTIEVKQQEYPRAYDTVCELVKATDSVVFQGTKYVEKTQRVFGQDALVIYHNEHKISFQLSPAGNTYLVVGMQKYLTPLLLDEMKKNGFAKDFAQIATEEELEELKRVKAERFNKA